MEINGLPLHPLLVHAAVVFGPLGALLALAYAALPRWRERLRLPMVALAVVAGLSVLAAYLSGDNFLESRPELGQLPDVQTHQDRAGIALWVTLTFSLVAVATAWLHERPGVVRVATNVLLAATAVGTLVIVVLTGDSGSRAVWGQGS